MSADRGRRVVRLEIPIESDDELAALNGALLAARATELSQMRRRGDRLAFGYGSDSARESISDEVDQAERRWTMLDRVLTALNDDDVDGHTAVDKRLAFGPGMKNAHPEADASIASRRCRRGRSDDRFGR